MSDDERIKLLEHLEEQNVEIKKALGEIRELTDSLNTVRKNFIGFNMTLRFMKNLMITLGALYLVFKDPIHKLFGS